MTILEKIKFEEDWLSEVNLTKENIKIAFAGIRATVLEQQPCEDCISREAVMKCFKKWQPYMATRLLDYEQELKELSSVTPKYTDEEIDKAQAVEQAYIDKMVELAVEELKTPKAEWIPVSERLPEDYIHVLCQFYLGGMGECYLAHGAFHVVGGLVMTCNEVVAWMPLPQPYNAESEEK